MSRVLALVEGHTERSFIKEVLAPDLGLRGVFLTAALIGKPGHKGGIRPYLGVRKEILAALKQDHVRYCTTMFDYCGLPRDWPGVAQADAAERRLIAERIEGALHDDICSALGPSFEADRFLPYIQMHEFEALLFSDPDILAETLQKPALASDFRSIVADCGDPEGIDDVPQTSPSARIGAAAGAYRKVVQGTIAAKRIGLPTMRERCSHFCEWVGRLEGLGRGER